MKYLSNSGILCISISVSFILAVQICSSANAISISEIESKPSFKREIRDFEMWLAEKIKNDEIDSHQIREPISSDRESSLVPRQWRKMESVEEKASDQNTVNVFSNEDFSRSMIRNFHPDISHESHHTQLPLSSNPNPREVQGPRSSGGLARDVVVSHESEHFPPKERERRQARHGLYPFEEVLYIRRSNSELNEPISDIVDAVIAEDNSNDAELELTPSAVSSNFADQATSEEIPLIVETCFYHNHSFSHQQLCLSGSQYEIEPHLEIEYWEKYREEIEKKLSPTQRHPDDSRCNYAKHFSSDHGVDERALCPSQWRMSARNPARIPEYLMIAECSCRVSRQLQQGACIQLMRKIPVLFRTGCSDGKHVYREGLEDVPVACVPVGREVARVRPANVFSVDRVE